ncbi:DsbA family protein [Paracoccus sp. (in: a-proteobacteria)]|uniref:DsbA family protein n=1 Tax=Paracoccus sp. TaxID=267 RepID=UPI0026DEA1AE|nr:DsbA family protein [Paracoccus sp. (in: a-proteobacteria)]MDO5647063.1 DsbA family protein [Paracoccus sp. (in: a-proteobacteria)]
MTTRRTVLAGLAAASVYGLGMAAITWRPRRGAADLDAIISETDGPILGNPNGDVTIVEFFDYQCSFCKRDYAALMDLVQRDGNIRLLMKDWPILGPASMTASQVVLGAASSGQYAAAHGALMATPGRLSDPQIARALAGAGVDTTAAMDGWLDNRERWEGWLSRNARQAASLGMQGTPGYIVGERVFAGAVPMNVLRDTVARARSS